MNPPHFINVRCLTELTIRPLLLSFQQPHNSNMIPPTFPVTSIVYTEPRTDEHRDVMVSASLGRLEAAANPFGNENPFLA